jgi:mannose-1-phosphate guanylyltransferase
MAAGLGTRLRPLTYVMPKPVAPVLNRPLISHIAELLAKHGYDEVIVNLSWLPDQIREALGDGSEYGLAVTYSEEAEPLGTAGGVGKARDFLSEGESFLVISGDALTDVDLTALREAHESTGSIATLSTKRVEDTTQFGVVITDEDGRIQGFQEKPPQAEALSDLANCGIYMFKREIFDYFPPDDHMSPAGDDDQPPGFVDWAMDVFPALLEGDVPFHSHEIDAYWDDIGSVADYVEGNFAALRGEVGIEVPGEETSEGARTASDLGGAKVTPPVLVGAKVQIGSGVDLHGPVVIGDGCTLGDGAMIRDAVVLPGTELAPGALVVGGLSGMNADRRPA